MNKATLSGLAFLGLFLAIGISVGGYFIGQTMYNAKVALNTAEAKGLAERRVKSDLATWNIRFAVAGTDATKIPDLYKKSEANQTLIIKTLQDSGLDMSEINAGVINYNYREFRDSRQVLVDEKHELTGTISIETDKVDQVQNIRANVNKLITQGINIQNNEPAYIFTKLNEIKPDMLREAAQNARIAASEFAENAGAKVGKIRSARQGGFNIRDAGESYGDTRKINKDIRVVTTITFYLTD